MVPLAPATPRAVRATVKRGGKDVAFTLLSPESCTGRLTGHTVASYAAPTGKHERRPLSLGSARFSLQAGKAKTVLLTLPSRPRRLLATKHRLAVLITISLKSAGRSTALVHRTLTLKLPRGREAGLLRHRRWPVRPSSSGASPAQSSSSSKRFAMRIDVGLNPARSYSLRA